MLCRKAKCRNVGACRSHSRRFCRAPAAPSLFASPPPLTTPTRAATSFLCAPCTSYARTILPPDTRRTPAPKDAFARGARPYFPYRRGQSAQRVGRVRRLPAISTSSHQRSNAARGKARRCRRRGGGARDLQECSRRPGPCYWNVAYPALRAGSCAALHARVRPPSTQIARANPRARGRSWSRAQSLRSSSARKTPATAPPMCAA